MGPGWCLQIYGKRPWENDDPKLLDDLKKVYRELVESDLEDEVRKVVEPFREEKRIYWGGLVKSKAAVVALVELYEELQREEDDVEILLLCI